jgi:EAL domain-containing protein (putative c-di-GMP-specific phosphodiesterase class I)
MADARLTFEVLTQLKHAGVRVSLGEFGSGHSSLTWLRRLPIDELKIDRAIVAGVLSDRHSSDIVSLIAGIARSLKSTVVAEGIESAVQLGRLEELGCELGQGYLFSHPVEAAKAEEWLQHQSKRAGAGR